MPLQNSLNTAPYNDDYDPVKDFYRVLFQPGVALQGRELNQIQSILQNQTEVLSNNIFKPGTIIEGCNIIFHPRLPYVKIRDIETDGTPVNVPQYQNLYVRNSANVSGFIVDIEEGFESRSPDLNSLFLRYNSSGADQNTATFAAGETLEVYTPEYPVFKYKVTDGSSGFSNSDSVVVVSAIAVQNSTGGTEFPAGGFDVNDVIQNGVANAVILEANNTANSEALVLKIRPLASDLQTANTLKWKFTSGETILNANTANTANVISVIGTNAQGSLITDSLGKILSITPINSGSGYYYPPHVGVSITSNSGIGTAEINQLNITGQNFLTNITVANAAQTPIGEGFGMSVDDGWIYQKGFAARVESQFLVVNKYSNTGFTKSVGFGTEEGFVDANKDPSLLDNATGTRNEAAPGADRLKLTPILYSLEKADADANSEFFPIVEFADGRPYRQNKQTVYNIIGEKLARRTFEESGNYVLDQFILATKDSSIFSENATVFKINIDPGTAYIQGYRLETSTNYTANVDKGTDVINAPTSTIKVGYGNYIRVNDLGGIFQFNTGAQISLRDTAANYITSNIGSTISGAGNEIGTGRIRSIELDQGQIGTAQAVYRLYLFDIVMNTGANFGAVRSVLYDGTNKGVADIELDITGNAILYDTQQLGLLYKPVNALQYANNISYTYRTMDQSKTANTTGFITITPPAGDSFPYIGELNSVEQRDVLVISLANYQASANALGTAAITSGSNILTGSAGNFLNAFVPGDFVKVANSTVDEIVQVQQVGNSTSMTLLNNATTTLSGNAVLYFPDNAPIAITSRVDRTVNVAANGQMTIALANTIANSSGGSSSANVAVVYNVTANNVNPAAKTTNRNILTRVKAANNAGALQGPWAMGVSDVFRLRGVYLANGASQTLTFDANTAIDNATDFITIADNVFANGDSVSYTVPTSNTVVTGLANNTSYFVVDANSSGFALSATRGGAKINITASALTETHNVTGEPLYFAKDTFNVQDITNDFYIDNNQREDYLDTSYLYLKPRSRSITNDDVFLIEYDAFTTGDGVVTVSSYSINDTANLTQLSIGTDINTLEIPEMIGTNGKYYDLRDQVDFRPISANTIPLTTDVTSTEIINPSEPLEANRFSGAEQRFPVPNSQLTANISYYVPRNDRVVLDKTGEFIIVKGSPGVTDAFPTEPKDSITLQYLSIPPYPSLPFSLSKETVEILDTKVANEKYGKRQENFKITTPIDKDARSRIQTKNYKMSDVATLERRLKDLEYYVSFTLAEAVARSKYIPSSNDPTVDRFKFGFFVDPYSDYSYLDVENPEFYASVLNDQLQPKLRELNFDFFFDTSLNGDVAIENDGLITLPFIEYELINQADATDGAIEEIVDVGNNIIGNTTSNTASNTVVEAANTSGFIITPTIIQSISTVIEQQKNTERRDSPPYVFDDFFYTFSSLAGPVELYMNHRDNNMAIEISQSTSRFGSWRTITTSAASVNVTQADLNTKGILSLNGGRKFEIGDGQRKSYGPVGGFKEDQQKLLWTYDPANGIYVRVRIYKGKNHGSQGSAGTYGYKLFYPTDTITNQTIEIQNPSNFSYIGTVNEITPRSFQLAMSYSNLLSGSYYPTGSYVADSQRFVISATGLKPNTRHDFIFAGEDQTAKIKQLRTTTTNTTGLLSDADGTLKFEFFYDAGIDEATSDLEQQYKLLAAVAGGKIFKIRSIDSTSIAAGEITLRFYSTVSPEILSSYANLNVTATVNTTINDYNYSSNLSQVIDSTAINTAGTDYTTRIWSSSGTSASISELNSIQSF